MITRKLSHYFKCFLLSLRNSRVKNISKFKIIKLEQDSNDNYHVIVQIQNKNQAFKMKPEEILADDMMTDQFSQRDVRTLTYLGYLGVNAPKYKILAKRLSEKDNRFVFAVKDISTNTTLIKTADEISNDKNFISGLNQSDAHMIGFTSATELSVVETKGIKATLSDEQDLVESS